MANFKIIQKSPIAISNVLEQIKKVKKEGKREIAYREDKILKYCKNLELVKSKDVEKFFDELKELEISRLDDEQIVKIIDVLPKNGSELRAIVSNSGTIIVDENVNKILDVVKKYI